MKILIEIEDPYRDSQGTKEAVAMALEPLGGKVRVISVTEDKIEQMRLGG